MKKVLLLLSLIPSALMAQTIGVEDAQNKALQFLQSQSQTRASQREVQLKLAYTSTSGDETYYYVFNNANGGYVIMGGDEAAREVLGYGETGSFDYARIPDNMRWWLSQYDLQISQAIREVKSGTNKVVRQAQTRAERADIPVMLTTKWGQDKPYNMQLPTSQSCEVEYHTGCSVTAMAQIMNYHRWPVTGVGSNTLPEEYFGHKFTADFENTHYDWDAMADTYDTIYSGTREEIAVGTLMYHLGVAFNSSYDDDGTETDGYLAGKALAENFRYNKGMSLLVRNFYNDTDWESMVYDELCANRPVFYTGHTEKEEGHAFVCDGYKDGHWHINWGWDGFYDNYFLLTPTSTEKALHPGGTGTGGGEEDETYAANQIIIVGLFPDLDGSTQYKSVLSMATWQLEEKSLVVGDTVAITMGFQNLGLMPETFNIRYKVVNIEDADDYFVFDDSCSLSINSFDSLYQKLTFCITDKFRTSSIYRIIPMFTDEKGEWQQTLKFNDEDFASIIISHGFELTEQLSVSNEGNVCKDLFDVSFSMMNYMDSTLCFPIRINVYPADEENADPVDYFDLGEITLAPHEERTIRVGSECLHFGDRMIPGKSYKLQAENTEYGSLLGTLLGPLVTCSFYETLSISLTVPEMGWATLTLPFDAEIPEGLKVYGVFFDIDDVYSIIFNKKDSLVRNCAYLIHGVPGTYQFIGPALELKNATLGWLYAHMLEGPLEEEEYYVLDQRDGIVGFYRIQEPTTIGKYEAFLISTSSKDVIVINDPDDDDPTSLNQIITHGTPIDSRIYDLNGRIISADHKGLVIRGGKVLIMKE